MKAILLKEYGDSSNLYMGETDTPTPKEGEVLVKVKATALNRADILQREGKYPPPPGASHILGLEFAGEVVKGAGKWQDGTRVMGIVGGGSYAEFVVTPPEHLIPVPKNLTFEEAASIPEAFLTAYQSLFWHGELKNGESVLIHAAGSGVGTAAIQLAKAKGAKEIFVTAGSEEKLKTCEELGATTLINYKESDFSKIISAKTENKGVNVILDFIGAPYWEQNISSLSVDGHLVLIASMGGKIVEKINLSSLFPKRAKIIATTLRSRSAKYKEELSQEFSEWALPLFERKILRPVIYKTLTWQDVKYAHALMEQNKNTGKIVLTID